ncbi:unnamed protein product [Hymenolepis diminuta]|uniref:Mediator of RNA polymerase II transcription subunit 6 n=1 Tax=Hymenolepis diminuta TaxID=6216 RepID=A0A0R3SWX1_HYMDI|nr:unnamed protein product [Hymenolepis diminuta]VUZ40489.1 unnamed protein product [Hymenolepis diminuta]
MDSSKNNEPSPYEILWQDPSFPVHQLNASNVLQYFCHLSNPFYDRESNNEVVRMQGLGLDRLTSLLGIEYYLCYCQEPSLFVIRKQDRISPSEVMPLAYYYVVNGVVRQCPDLGTLINSRIHSITANLNKIIQELAPCARFHPSDGSYSWQNPKAEVTETTKEVKKKPTDDLVATNPYQVHRTDFLLNEWASRFPPMQLQTLSASQTPSAVTDAPPDRRPKLM